MHSNQDPSAAKNKLKKKFKLSGNRSIAGDMIASFQKYLKACFIPKSTTGGTDVLIPRNTLLKNSFFLDLWLCHSASWDLSSPTKDGACAPSSASAGAQVLESSGIAPRPLHPAARCSYPLL